VLRRELHLTPQEFNRKYRRSPILRAKRRGFLRNLAVALGNQADSTAIPDLETVLAEEPEPLVRAHVAWALGRMPSARAHLSLDKALRTEPDAAVRQEIQAALDQTPPPKEKTE
jgi:epoxyqueuosine reductase